MLLRPLQGEPELVPLQGEPELVPLQGEPELVPLQGESELVPLQVESELVPLQGENLNSAERFRFSSCTSFQFINGSVHVLYVHFLHIVQSCIYKFFTLKIEFIIFL